MLSLPLVGVHDRKYLAQVQTRLRDVAGVSVIIYEQTCAAGGVA